MRTRLVATISVLLNWLGLPGSLANSRAADAQRDALSSRVHLDGSAGAPEVLLASSSHAAMSIIIPAKPAPTIKLAAEDLAKMLEQISGANFQVTPSTVARNGIIVASASDFPGLNLEKALPVNAPEDRNHYILRTEKDRILCVGASEFGASHAVYDLLRRLGCRWYFPFANWEAIPRKTEILLRADVEERPDYFAFTSPSQAWGGGDWNRRNRNHESPYIYSQHSLGGIYDALEKAGKLKGHPEYNAMQKENPQRQFSGWPCLSSAGARKLIAEHVLEYFRQNPTEDSFSLEPPDGDGWCNCVECQKSRPIDLLVNLSNEVAAAVQKEFPGKLVGSLSYNRHSFPPSIRVHQCYGVSPTTGFNYSGLSTEDLLAAWKKMMDGPYLGVYDYWYMPCWHNGLIGARGGQIEYMKSAFPKYYQLGVRTFTPECIDGWAPNGLAYYAANSLAWNIDADIDAVIADFLKTMFGKAARPMREFYRHLNMDPDFLMSRDYRGRLFSALAEARKLENDPSTVVRLDELTLYISYVDHYYRWQAGEIQFEDCMSFLWKADRTTELFDRRKWVWKYLPTYHHRRRPVGHGDQIPDNWISRDSDMPDDKDPWKAPGKFTHAEIAELNEEGVARNPIIPALDSPTAFSSDLVPCGSRFQDPQPIAARNSDRIYLYANKDGTLPPIKIWGKTKWTLSRYDKTTHGYTDVESATTPPEERMSQIIFKTTGDGLYALNVACASKATYSPLDWDDSKGYQITMDARRSHWRGPGANRWAWFLVPTGTKQVVIWMEDPQVRILDSSGTVVFDGRNGSEASDIVPIVVPLGQDGRIWRIWGEHPGSYEMLNVPTYVAASPDELLKPRECGYNGP